MTPLQTPLETLLKTALLGTGREGGALQLEGALQEFGASPAGAEAALLGTAAAATLGTRSGKLPAQSNTPAIPLCPAEAQPYFSVRATSLLEACFSNQHDLIPQALQWAAQSRQLAPPSLLVPLLELGRRSKELRRSIAPILGERGRWLAQLNPEWQQVAAPLDENLETSWQEGELAARREALRLQREMNPTEARAWVMEAFKTDGAKERAQWLETLKMGLSDEDEPFLEKVLDDKSKEVRAVAVSLLEKLPHSRLIERAKAELEPLLTWNSKTHKVEVELPPVWKKEWARDGLEEKVSAYNRVRNMGERASWLRQWLEKVPPSTWEQKWGETPARIVAGVPKEWHNMLLMSWWDAAKTEGNSSWLEAIASSSDVKSIRVYLSFGDLSPALADSLALVLWEREAQNLKGGTDDNNSLRNLLMSHPGPWSFGLARLFLRMAHELIAETQVGNNFHYLSPAYWLRSTLVTFADKIPIELAAEAGEGWPEDEPFQQNWAPVVTQFLARLQLRADLQAAFSKPTP